jgi:signal transduction histidine kinase
LALIDSTGKVVAADKGWMGFAKDSGAALSRVGPGSNYLQTCSEASGPFSLPRPALVGIRAVLKGRKSSFVMDYSLRTSSGLRQFRLEVISVRYGDARVAVNHTDITDQQRSRETDYERLQEFARRLMHAQEEERQRIAQEIHDDIGNRLAVISFSVRQAMKSSDNPGVTVEELSKVLDGVTNLASDLRNLSHRLHPSLLRWLGVRGAVKSLQEKFKETNEISIEVSLPAEMPRLSDEVELCIFRIAQESLQNVVKHSGAAKVRLALRYMPGKIRMVVSDTGRGFDPSEVFQGGLGLLSMEERALSVGGKLTVKSSRGGGTRVHLMIPLKPERTRQPERTRRQGRIRLLRMA